MTDAGPALLQTVNRWFGLTPYHILVIRHMDGLMSVYSSG